MHVEKNRILGTAFLVAISPIHACLPQVKYMSLVTRFVMLVSALAATYPRTDCNSRFILVSNFRLRTGVITWTTIRARRGGYDIIIHVTLMV